MLLRLPSQSAVDHGGSFKLHHQSSRMSLSAQWLHHQSLHLHRRFTQMHHPIPLQTSVAHPRMMPSAQSAVDVSPVSVAPATMRLRKVIRRQATHPETSPKLVQRRRVHPIQPARMT